MVIVVLVTGGRVARFMLVRILRRSMVMSGVVMTTPCLESHWRRRAKGHRHGRVALEGHGKHQEPKQDCAQAKHMKNSNLACRNRRECEFEPSHGRKVKRASVGMFFAFERRGGAPGP